MKDCARCMGTGKFKLGGMDTKCKCHSVSFISEPVKEINKFPDIDIMPPSIKKKRKRREGQGANIGMENG
jgi:hypothetical protein